MNAFTQLADPADFIESARINLRTSQEAKSLIERAAALMGTTVSAFMLQNSYEAAQRVLLQNEAILLSEKAFLAFVETCEQAAPPNAALKALMRRAPDETLAKFAK